MRELRRKASIASRWSFSEGLYGISNSNNGSAISLSRKSSLGDKYVKPLERESSLRMRRLKARVRGTTPVGFGTRYVDERHGEMGIKELSPVSDSEHSALYSSPSISASTSTSSAPDLTSNNAIGEPVCALKKKRNSQKGRLVAVKLTPRKPAVVSTPGMTKREREGEEERTRVGFVREVEILKVCVFISVFSVLYVSCWEKSKDKDGDNFRHCLVYIFICTSGDGFFAFGKGWVADCHGYYFGGRKKEGGMLRVRCAFIYPPTRVSSQHALQCAVLVLLGNLV